MLSFMPGVLEGKELLNTYVQGSGVYLKTFKDAFNCRVRMGLSSEDLSGVEKERQNTEGLVGEDSATVPVIA